jgi:large subunit ribosomal protein L9
MKIILREDVANLGKSGELVEVRNGYGRNYLLPQNLAVLASEKNLAQLAHERKVITAKQAKQRAGALEVAKQLGNAKVKISRKVGEQDKLFGSVTTLDIADALAAAGVKIDRRSLHLAEPIKTLGSFDVEVRLHPEVPAKVKVEVVAVA